MGVAPVENSKTVRLYLRLPVQIIDEQQVRELHPGIVKVTLPRQRSRRYCIVDFDTTNANSTLKELRAIKVEGKKLIVNLHRTKKHKS